MPIVKDDEHKQISYKSLDSKVLVIASVTKCVKEWAAYIGAVPGEDHKKEWEQVYKRGTKIDKRIAAILFPYYAIEYNWRD